MAVVNMVSQKIDILLMKLLACDEKIAMLERMNDILEMDVECMKSQHENGENYGKKIIEINPLLCLVIICVFFFIL